ncbi:MAG: hypothetical protein Q9186_002409 [Xanthomendoza sp. 1 TL-2023]
MMTSFTLPYAHLEQIVDFLVTKDKHVESTQGHNGLAKAPPLSSTTARPPKSKKRRPVASDWFTPEATPDPHPITPAQTRYTIEDIERLIEEEITVALNMKEIRSELTLAFFSARRISGIQCTPKTNQEIATVRKRCRTSAYEDPATG